MQQASKLLALVALTAACGVTQAQTQTVKVGGIRYQTHAKTNGVTGIGVTPGADAEVGSANTVLFTYEYEFMPNIGAELVLGVPPTIRAKGAGSVAFLGEILKADNVAPTLLINYHFGSNGDALRPYVGLGVNYTTFTNVSSTLGWDIKMSSSWGLAAQVGADYALDKQWGLFASLGYADVKSKLVGTGATVIQTTIDFRPITYSFGASMRF